MDNRAPLVNTGHTRKPDARTLPRVNQRVWRVLRLLKSDFDIAHVAMMASTSEGQAREYINLLLRGGFMNVAHQGGRQFGNTSRYNLVRDTGPLCPKRMINVMLDQNTGKVFDMPHRTSPVFGKTGNKLPAKYAFGLRSPWPPEGEAGDASKAA